MNNLIEFIKGHINHVLLVLGGLVICAVVGIQLFCLNRTLIVSDEGYYLCLIRDIADAGNSRYQFLFQNCLHNNIYAYRLLVWLLFQISLLCLGWGIGSYVCKKNTNYNKWWVYALAIISVYAGSMFIDACPSPNYITLNRVVLGFSIGMLLLAISYDWIIAYVLSGFFLAALFPIMITNLVIFPFVLLPICVESKKKFLSIGAFLSGIVLFFGVYFAYAETPSSLLNYLQSKTQASLNNPNVDYGIIFWIQWGLEVLLYWLKMLIMALFAYGSYHLIRRKDWKRVLKYATFAICVGMGFLYFWKNLQPIYAFRYAHSVTWTKDLYWITFFAFAIDMFVKKQWQDWGMLAVGFLLAISSFCLCFGTDVPFIGRQGGYWMFLLPVLFLFCGELTSNKKLVLVGVVAVNLLVFVAHLFSSNWNYESYLKSSVPVESIGINQNIKLEQKYIDRLAECKEIIPMGENVIIPNSGWGLAALLDYHLLGYDYCIMSLNPEEYPAANEAWMHIDRQIQDYGYCWIIASDWEEMLQKSIEEQTKYQVKVYSGNNETKYYHLTEYVAKDEGGGNQESIVPDL